MTDADDSFDKAAVRYTPRQVNNGMLRVGTVALSTFQCALIVAVVAQARDTRCPMYHHARRTLAAWLNDEHWHRYTFDLRGAGPWHKIAESLNKHGILEQTEPHQHEDGPLSPGYKLTDYGQAIAELLGHICPATLTGKKYAEFIERQKALSARKKRIADPKEETGI